MKGLILSLVFFALYVISTAFLSHALRPKRHSMLFFPAALAWSPFYFLAFFVTPPDLHFLPPSWTAQTAWLDATYGYVIFLLNCHSFIDFFFGFNGGFSTSLLLQLLRSEPGGMTMEDLVANYVGLDGVDKIHGWRLPRLEDTGYIRIDKITRACALTGKGRAIARLAWFLKRVMNLGAGG